MRKILVISIFLLITTQIYGQSIPVYSHYFMNPYLYNPAYAGSEGKGALFLTHRRQWVGIDGAPVTSNITFHTPLTRGLNFGLNLSWDETSILNTYSGLITLGYAVKFSRMVFFRLGISGGAIWNSVDLNQIDLNPNDPVYANLLSNSMSLDGNAGVSLHIGTFALGASLPHIFSTKTLSQDFFTVGDYNSALDEILFTASYRQYFGQDQFAFEPRFFYHLSKSGQSQWEGMATLDIKNILWIGGSYNEDRGFTGLAGIKVRGSLAVGYAVGFGLADYSGLKNATHEFQLAIALGKGRKKLNQKYSFMDMRRSIEAKPVPPTFITKNIRPNQSCSSDDGTKATGAFTITPGDNSESSGDFSIVFDSYPSYSKGLPSKLSTTNNVKAKTSLTITKVVEGDYQFTITSKKSGLTVSGSLTVPSSAVTPVLNLDTDISVENIESCNAGDGSITVKSVSFGGSPVSNEDFQKLYTFEWYKGSDFSSAQTNGLIFKGDYSSGGAVLNSDTYPGFGPGTYWVVASKNPSSASGNGCPSSPVSINVSDRHVNPSFTLSEVRTAKAGANNASFTISPSDLSKDEMVTDFTIKFNSYPTFVSEIPSSLTTSNKVSANESLTISNTLSGVYTFSITSNGTGCTVDGSVNTIETVTAEIPQDSVTIDNTVPVDSVTIVPEDTVTIEPTLPVNRPGQGETPVIVKKGTHLLELPEGHYVINGAFSSLENAQRYSDKLFQMGYKASFGYVTVKNLYYVFVYKTDSAEKARAERDKLRRNDMFKDAWYLLVEK